MMICDVAGQFTTWEQKLSCLKACENCKESHIPVYPDKFFRNRSWQNLIGSHKIFLAQFSRNRGPFLNITKVFHRFWIFGHIEFSS